MRISDWSSDVCSSDLNGTVSSLTVTASGAIVTMNSLTAPDDLYRIGDKRSLQRLTIVNGARLAGIDMPSVSKFSFAGANGDTVWGYAARPAGLTGKAPIAFVAHGGPQGSSNNSWSYRWNPAVFAGSGYAVVAIDFHG